MAIGRKTATNYDLDKEKKTPNNVRAGRRT